MVIPCQVKSGVTTMADECKPVQWRLAPLEVQGYLNVEDIVYSLNCLS